MKMELTCIPCMFSQIKHLIHRGTSDAALQAKCYNAIMDQLAKTDFTEVPPPAICGAMLRTLGKILGDKDLYQQEKDRSTELAIMVKNKIFHLLENAKDPFAAYTKLTCGGNIIDFGVNEHFDLENAEKQLTEVLDFPVDPQKMELFRERVQKAERILYILDNCGEAVFDALFIRKFLSEKEVTLVCRGGNTLNDVTQRELESSGLGGLPCITTGDVCPGAVPASSSPEFLQALQSAEMVIAKGQGNFESLSGVSSNIFFLFRVKCPVVQKYLKNAPLFSIQVTNIN